jgi:hypothetical protein
LVTQVELGLRGRHGHLQLPYGELEVEKFIELVDLAMAQDLGPCPSAVVAK